ncbi:hypothetical protein AAFC00_005624 [Neodothiora populina]|uniref:Protein HIR n=1 Tax=Neodothiora populina TaxID=2781224 RepID=A0ABR3PLJ2_9PEZI
MRFTKPLWLTHGGDKKDFEVYSCHVSPDGSRLVTAGGDGHVRIWSTEAIANSGNASYNKPKQLAAMSHHSGTIHSVRFSGNGRYLASGADDKIVCVYNLDPTPPAHTTFGSNETPPVENWRIYRRLIGHDNDVQDLGWSCDSSILVSVGLDSKVVIWSGHTFEKLKTLSQHQSHVKGITFDPANKYFATTSDDRTMRIYRFTSPLPNSSAYDQGNNFTLEHTVTAPFLTSPLTTYFRRCSWSPDGAHIAAANSVNGPVSSVAIITRGTWDSEVNLIGHEGPVEVCAFSPRMFCSQPPPPLDVQNEKDYHPPPAVTVVACAGQDKTLSVWNTSSPRPFVITQELAAKSISDLAWSPDGETIYMTSLDGTIASCIFDTGELGYPAPLLNNDKSLARYGAGRRLGIVEGTDALKLEENSKAGEIKGAQGRMGELMGHGSGAPALNGELAKPSAATTNGANTPSIAANGDAQPKDAIPAATPDPQVAKIDKLKQRVTITKDGKKRIQPLLVSSASGVGESSLPRPQLMSTVAQRAGDDTAKGATLDLSKPFDGLPRGGLASLLLGNKRKFAEVGGDDDQRAQKRIASVQQTGATPIVMNATNGLVPPSLAAKPASTEPPEALRPAITNPSLTVSQVRLAVPLVRSMIVRPMDVGVTLNGENGQSTENAMDDAATILEARNASGPARTGRAQDREPTRLNVSRRGQSIWQDYLPRAVLLVTGNQNFWAAACEDGSLYVWTPAGRRMINAMILEAQPVILDCKGWWLLAVTAIGVCYVWDIRSLSSPHPPVSLAPVLDIASSFQQAHLTHAPAVMFARLNSQGRIIVGMSNGDGFSYSPSMYAWQRLSEPWWAVGSQYWNTADTSISAVQSAQSSRDDNDDEDLKPENISAGIIPYLERNTTTQALLRGRSYFLQRLVKTLLVAEGFEGFESSVSIAHLENRVAAAMTLGAKEEFRLYLMMYAKRIGAEGVKGKVEELLRGLMGTIYEDEEKEDQGTNGNSAPVKRPNRKAGDGWMVEGDTMVGWKRGDLLKEVVLILGKHRDLQRTTVPYARFLGVLEGDSDMVTDI